MIVDQEAVVTSPVALSGTAATLATSQVPTPSNVNPGVAGVYGIARLHIPYIANLPAGAAVTANICRGDTGAVIGSATCENTGSAAAPVGPLTAVGVIPAGVSSVYATALSSSGTPAAQATATAPILLEVDLNLGIG